MTNIVDIDNKDIKTIIDSLYMNIKLQKTNKVHMILDPNGTIHKL